MPQSSDSQKSQFSSNSPVKTASASGEQTTIGASLVIKGEVSGSESLYINGRIEGTVNFADNRVTIAPNGSVLANISALALSMILALIPFAVIAVNDSAAVRAEVTQAA